LHLREGFLEFFLRNRAITVGIGLHQHLTASFRQLVFGDLAVLVLVEAIEDGIGLGRTAGPSTFTTRATFAARPSTLHLLASGFEFFGGHGTVAVRVDLVEVFCHPLARFTLGDLSVAVLVEMFEDLLDAWRATSARPLFRSLATRLGRRGRGIREYNRQTGHKTQTFQHGFVPSKKVADTVFAYTFNPDDRFGFRREPPNGDSGRKTRHFPRKTSVDRLRLVAEHR
jgi:hypothetical protein